MVFAAGFFAGFSADALRAVVRVVAADFADAVRVVFVAAAARPGEAPPVWRVLPAVRDRVAARVGVVAVVAARPFVAVNVAPLAAGAAAAVVGAVSPRVVRDSAARALPAAVCSPFAFVAFDAATRARAAFAAAARPVVRPGLVIGTSDSPPNAALSFSISRLLRRAAAFRWMDPFRAARSSAETAAMSASRASSTAPDAASRMVLATYVFAAVRRGRFTTSRRSC